MKFEELNLAPAILKAVLEQGYDTPTPIQAQSIPSILAGRDLLGGAQTGTGKTAAFTLPVLHKLATSERPKSKFNGIGIRALVLTPTRELAAQVEESIRTYGKYLDLTSTVIFGGVGMNPQISKLKKGVDLLVATPGRLLDLQQQGMLDLGQVQVLILDEADRMLDMGFIHDVKKVLALLPQQKQSLLFSATFSDEIRDLAANLLNNPEQIQVTPRNTTVQRITQVIHPVGRTKKKALLAHIIKENNWSQVLVFTRTKFGANNVAEFLEKNGITAMALHGNKSQSARTQALAGFKSGDVRALVATDIAARGIDIDDLPHVVNYEIPNVSEDYVHRIGRTGRAGADGQAVNFVCLDEEGFMKDVEAFTKQQIPVQFIEGFGPDEGEKAEPLAMGRQTIWGGLGKPPSREVMAAAARAARSEMMDRVRTKRAAGGGAGQGQGQRRGNGNGSGNANGNSNPNSNPNANRSRPPQRRTPDNRNRPQEGGMGFTEGNDDIQPRNIRHDAGRNVTGYSANNQDRRNTAGGQPDPLRTSVDVMAGSGRRGGGGGGRGGNRSGGGGFPPRGGQGGGGNGGGRPPRSFGR